MIDIDLIFKFKKINRQRLISYGFTFSNGVYTYQRAVMGDGYILTVTVSENGGVDYYVKDTATDEEYTLVKVSGAEGAFLGDMRIECEKILRDIANRCFDTDTFKSEQTRRIVNYIRCDLGAEPEYLWEAYPNFAVFRHESNNKWFAIIMSVDRSKFDPLGHGETEIIDLKADADTVADIVDSEKYFRGYHMNKKYWYTVPLDGTLDDNTVIVRINDSFDITKK